jgi:DNA-binding transcriptional MerR regulator
MAEAAGIRAAERRYGKSAGAFRTISEVAGDLDVPQHVLRFWETKFSQVRPLKRGGGRRYYRPEDIALLRQIKSLLYDDGYTIKGVQKLLKEGGGKPGPLQQGPAGASGDTGTGDAGGGLAPAARREMQGVLDELVAVRDLLKARS